MLIYSNSLNAFVFSIIKLVNNNHKVCYLFAVNHISDLEINNANNFQRRDFIELAHQLNGAVIVEDAFVYNCDAIQKDFLMYNNNDYYCLFPLLLFFKQNQDMLLGLSSLCYYADVPVTNVEFRHYEFAQNYTENELNALSKFIKNQIKEYSDGPLLTEIYSVGLRKYKQELKISKNNTDGFFYAQSHLLDMRIIHQLIDYEEKYDTIFIAAGGWHIQNLQNYLIKLGYSFQDCVEIHPHAKNIRSNSLKNIFCQYFDYKPQKTINDRRYHLLIAMLEMKNFCDETLLRYFFNRYTTSGILSFLLALPSYSFHNSKFALMGLSSLLWISMIKIAPKFLRTPYRKKLC